MFAVIKTGGKQYRVAESDVIQVGKLEGAHGDAVSFGEVLMVSGDAGVSLGGPLVQGAKVAGEIVDQGRTRTVLVFKKRRRQNSKRSHGHRQDFTLVRITEILTDGKKPSDKAPPRPKREAKPKAAAEAAGAEGDEQPAKKAAPKAKAKKPATKANKPAAKRNKK